jgi:hypothetical protein
MATLTTIPVDNRLAERNLGTYGRDHRARGDPTVAWSSYVSAAARPPPRASRRGEESAENPAELINGLPRRVLCRLLGETRPQ